MNNFLTNPSAEYLRNNVLWMVYLNNDIKIYQNEEHDDISSWLKLKKYLDINKDIYIDNMYLIFRDHYEEVGRNKKFFFFSFKMLGNISSPFSQSFYIGGCGDNIDAIHCKHFMVPELLLCEDDIRDGNSDLCRRGLIAHPDYIENFNGKYYE